MSSLTIPPPESIPESEAYAPSDADMAEFFSLSRGIQPDLSCDGPGAVGAVVHRHAVYRGECKTIQLRLGHVGFTLSLDQVREIVLGVAQSDREAGYEILNALEGVLARGGRS